MTDSYKDYHNRIDAPSLTRARIPLSYRYNLTDLPGSLRELCKYKRLVWYMTVRHFRSQYKQSLLGYSWAVLSPLAYLFTLAFVFSIIFEPPSQGSPYTLFLALGLLPWIFFSSAVTSATDSVVGAANLVTTVYFPREIILIAAVLVRLIDLTIGLGIIVALIVYTNQPVYWTIVWTPLIFLIHFLFVIGLSLPLAALNLFFHDIRFLVGVVLNLWFFFTPIFYSMDIVPNEYSVIYELNPNARLIAAYRYAVLSGVSPPLESLASAGLITAVSIIVGIYIFKKMEPAFADSI